MGSFFKKAMIRMTSYYTVLTVLYSLITWIRNANTEGGAGASAMRIFLFLPFSFLFGIANTFVRRPAPDPIVRWAFHCLLTVGGAFLCIVLPLGGKGAQLLTGLVAMLVLYGISVPIILLTRKRFGKALERDKELRASGRR